MKNSMIKVVLLLALGFLLVSAESRGQYQDTVLNAVISKPFFYNIQKSEGNTLFAGTSEGIFEIDDVSLRPYSPEKGYITINKKGEPIIDKNGIKFHRSNAYSYLLPYPEMGSERSYYVGLENLFYLCSGGRLLIFDILPYRYSFPNHSIRSISKDLTGTYSGIYLKGKKLSEPAQPFTDGYVRQFGDRGFVCSYPLLVLEKDAMESGQLRLDTNCFFYKEPNGLLVSDIVPAKNVWSYYVATMDKLIAVDYSFSKDSVCYRKKDKNLPIILIPGDPERLYFTAGRELLTLTYADDKTSTVLKLKEPIQGATFFGYHIYLITENALFRYNSDKTLEKLTDLEQAHTLGAVLGDQLLIGSNLGLFHYNLVSNTLSVVIKNVEFNRGALYSDYDQTKSVDNIMVGSINGLYTFRLSDIPELIARNKPQVNADALLGNTTLLISTAALLLVTLLGFYSWTYRKKLKSAESVIEELQTPKEAVTREQIEQYIADNLQVASIKSLLDEFKLNAPQLYAILKPDKPGSIIQQLRLDLVKKMREEGKPINDIAEATGLSLSYLKKLKT